jgi:hypothetical protein
MDWSNSIGPAKGTFREGKPQSFTLYQSKADALEAAGLSE